MGCFVVLQLYASKATLPFPFGSCLLGVQKIGSGSSSVHVLDWRKIVVIVIVHW